MGTQSHLSVVSAIAVVLLDLAAAPALAAIESSWEASSGLLPTQICPPWTLSDNASPEDPVLGSQFLTISTSQDSENMFYIQTGPTVDTSGSFFVEAMVRLVSGSFSTTPARAPIEIFVTTAPSVGNALFIRSDEVFFATDDVGKGPSAFVDTDGAFHAYRIEVNGATGLLSLFYDGSPILAGQTFTSTSFNGLDERIAWGEGSLFATGSSEWASVKHNALVTDCAVPEPSMLMVFGGVMATAYSIMAFQSERRRRKTMSR